MNSNRAVHTRMIGETKTIQKDLSFAQFNIFCFTKEIISGHHPKQNNFLLYPMSQQ